MSVRETYRIAHTARCKLQLAADRPDRNLRFILGHAFTLDKLRLQIAQIEESMESDSESDDLDAPSAPSPRGVSFSKSTNRPSSSPRRRRSPSPQRPDGFVEADRNSYEDAVDDGEEEDEEEDEGLGLTRYASASAQPPRMIDDDGSDEEEDLPSPPGSPSEEELRLLTGGGGNSELADMYQRVAGCPCQNHQLPVAEKAWDIPQKLENEGPRLAVIQVTG